MAHLLCFRKVKGQTARSLPEQNFLAVAVGLVVERALLLVGCLKLHTSIICSLSACREPGVRALRKHLEKIYRKLAMKMVQTAEADQDPEASTSGAKASEALNSEDEETGAGSYSDEERRYPSGDESSAVLTEAENSAAESDHDAPVASDEEVRVEDNAAHIEAELEAASNSNVDTAAGEEGSGDEVSAAEDGSDATSSAAGLMSSRRHAAPSMAKFALCRPDMHPLQLQIL